MLAPTSRDNFVGSLPVRPTYTVALVDGVCVLCCCLAFRRVHAGKHGLEATRGAQRATSRTSWPCLCNAYSRVLHEVGNIARAMPLTCYILLNEPLGIDRVHMWLLCTPARMTGIKASGHRALALGAPALLSAQVSVIGAKVPVHSLLETALHARHS